MGIKLNGVEQVCCKCGTVATTFTEKTKKSAEGGLLKIVLKFYCDKCAPPSALKLWHPEEE